MNPTIDQPGPIRAGEQFDTPRLEQYLKQQLPGYSGPLSVEQFPSGYSNLTYLLTFNGEQWVLRRPPFGNEVKSAHDMGREFRILSQLCHVYPPAPRPLLYCDDVDVMGDEFYLMERRHGRILRGPQAPPEMADDESLARRVCESFVDNLARLHCLDVAAAGLEDFGRPQGYIARQVSGWTARYDKAQTDEIPEITELTKWLAVHQPADGSPAIIHNDYKYDNLVLEPDNLAQIVAVLDWEMATVGDPWMDLGGALAYWIQEDDPPLLRQRAFGPTLLPGSMNRQELVERYVAAAGEEARDPLFYYAFGVFKLLVIVQQIYARYVRGHTGDRRFADFDALVHALATAGLEATGRGRL